MKLIAPLALVILSLTTIESVANARDTTCSELPKGDKAACEVKAQSVCASVEGYWPKKQCVTKVTEEFNLCTKDGTFAAMCAKQKSAYFDICLMKARELDMNKPSTIPEFKRRALAYQQTLKEAKSFQNEWGICLGSPKCAVAQSDVQTCEKEGQAYKKALSAAVDWYLGTTMQQHLSRIDVMMGGKFYLAAQNSVASEIQLIATLRGLNRDLPTLAHRDAELAKADKALRGMVGIIDGIAQKAIASVRCPKGANNNKSLVRAMRGTVNSHFGKGIYAKKVKVLRLRGKKTVTQNVYRKETTESYPAVACTEGLPTGKDANVCRVFSISVKRTRVKRKPWGPWATYVGDSQTMLCKNLK